MSEQPPRDTMWPRQESVPPQPKYNRIDLMVAIGLAALVAVWLLVYAVLLLKHGVHNG